MTMSDEERRHRKAQSRLRAGPEESRVERELRRAGWRIRSEPSGDWPDDWRGDRGSGWSVILSLGGRSMTTPFYMGSAHVGEPSLSGVLSSLVSDATSLYNARDFEEWASELGFDPDSRKAEKLFRRTLKQTQKLEKLVGGEDRVWALSKLMEDL